MFFNGSYNDTNPIFSVSVKFIMTARVIDNTFVSFKYLLVSISLLTFLPLSPLFRYDLKITNAVLVAYVLK